MDKYLYITLTIKIHFFLFPIDFEIISQFGIHWSLDGNFHN